MQFMEKVEEDCIRNQADFLRKLRSGKGQKVLEHLEHEIMKCERRDHGCKEIMKRQQ